MIGNGSVLLAAIDQACAAEGLLVTRSV
jgi:hypothetical protein